MDKVRQALGVAGTFLSDVKTEMKKSSWPTRAELVESTLVVIVSVVLLGAFVGMSDALLVSAIKLLVS